MTDLHFCNFCDQSVAQAKLDAGDAIRHGGRVVCPTCCDTLAMATQSSSPKSYGGRIFLVLLVALLAVAGSILQMKEQKDVRADLTEQLGGFSERITQSEADSRAALQQGKAEVDDKLESFRQNVTMGFSTMTTDLLGHDETLTSLRGRIEALEGLRDGQSGLQEEIQLLRARIQVVEENARELRKATEFLRDHQAELERQISAAEVAARSPSAGEFSDAVEQLLADLKADDPVTRLGALEDLTQHSDPGLIPYVEPLLEDPYEMSRFYAAFLLGEWQAMVSVPALIAALDDEFAFVSESVNEALVKIAKEDQGYDPKGSEREREKAIGRWQAWWEKNGKG